MVENEKKIKTILKTKDKKEQKKKQKKISKTPMPGCKSWRRKIEH